MAGVEAVQPKYRSEQFGPPRSDEPGDANDLPATHLQVDAVEPSRTQSGNPQHLSIGRHPATWVAVIQGASNHIADHSLNIFQRHLMRHHRAVSQYGQFVAQSQSVLEIVAYVDDREAVGSQTPNLGKQRLALGWG